jgi:3'5'-cyclic nucleotide phosphodiesterase
MSVTKLLSRIVAPSDILLSDAKNTCDRDLLSRLHDHTYGITSDPLTQFACVFTALIHDVRSKSTVYIVSISSFLAISIVCACLLKTIQVDHPGVPNNQLVKEGNNLAVLYKGRSVAEQNSINLAWDLLMEPAYTEFRDALCSGSNGIKRFRQLVVNAIMATDIMDSELKQLRDGRWKKAFCEEAASLDPSEREQVNRKATVVIEHIIQASDVAHTMQHVSGSFGSLGLCITNDCS